jgi:hypothetical protein
MEDWKTQMFRVRKDVRDANRVTLRLPKYFNFKDHDAFDFDKALALFDWSLRDRPILIDFTGCKSANYQALSLVVLYAWRMKSNGCRVEFLDDGNIEDGGAIAVWRRMGARGLFSVCFNENQNFRSSEHKPLLAIRSHDDFSVSVAAANKFAESFNVEYKNTLRYVVSELLYNTLEHGIAFFEDETSINRRLPGLIQISWYAGRDEIQFIIGDVGQGIRSHLRQAYPDIEDDETALRKAIQPRVSGTFGPVRDPYATINNAGMGLFLSTNIVRRLKANMHLVSGNAVLHVSPTDITAHTLKHSWPGTFAVVSLQLEHKRTFDFEGLLSEFRLAADREQAQKDKVEEAQVLYLSVYNYFGTHPEDKAAAIKYRDTRLLPAIAEGKKILLDFDDVVSSPHSFLNALLATPIRRMGINAFKRIKIVNARPNIRETIDFVLEDNTSEDSLRFPDASN